MHRQRKKMDENLPDNYNQWSSSALEPSTKKNDSLSSSTMPSSSYLSPSSVDQRIRALKKAIQKATEEALQRTNPAMMLQDSENNPNASFHLGMELFGSAEPAKMERAIQEQLVELEQQVQRLRLLSVEQQHEQQHDGPDEVLMMEPRRMMQGEVMTVPRVAISLDASVLQFKVQFLKQCSQVRQLIDESIAWSDPSYSSSCTDPTETSSSFLMTMMTGTGGEVDMIQAMSKLLEAETVWEQTHESLMDFWRKQQQQEEEPREDGQSNNNNSSNNNSKSTKEEQELQSCRDMMEWLRQDIRNPKVELMCHIQTLWNACVTLESETLFVRGFDRPLKSSASSHCNPTTMMTTTTSPPRPPLEQVYGVLQVLTEQQQGQQQQQKQGHSLQKELLLPFATRLYEQVLRPVLDGHENKKTNNNKSRRLRPVKWIFHESQERGTSSALLSSSSSSSALMTQLGPVKSLEWTRENNDQEEDEDNNTLERKEEEEEDVVAAWKETLEFVQYILVFVADHVLLGRSDLCQLLGQRLLGRPKAQVATGVNNHNKNNQKNNNELLGLTMTTTNAFQLIGKDDGILMEPLVDLMMDTCLPDFVSPNKKKKKKQTDEECVDCGCDLVQELRHVQSRLQTIVLPFLETLQTHGLLHESSSTTTTATMTNVMQDLATTTTTTTETTNSSNNESCRLYEFVHHFMAHYIHHRHSLLLDEARTLILQDKDFHNTQSVGVDPMTITSEEDRRLGLDPGLDLFVLHQSCVSETALSLHQLCVACMDEAVDTAVALAVQANATTTTGRPDMALDDLPATLYQTARQVLDLYRAIVPVRYGKEIAQVPCTAAIFYSDCVFLAHHCHSLGLLYRDKFPEGTSTSASSNSNSDLRRVCIFVDKVPLFRDMADRCMKEMLDRQSHQIQELVHPRIPLLSKALRSTEIVAEWADAETALNAALYHLQHLAQQWKPVLAQRMFHSTLGYLAHVLFTLFLEPVLAAPDLSTDACEFVHDLFGKALDRVQTLLQVSSSASQSSTGAAFSSSSWNGNKEEEDDGVVAMVPTWNRFKAVGQFMDMTLNDVEVALSQGVFASVTGQELSRLLMAAHDESPRRQELLKLIKQQ